MGIFGLLLLAIVIVGSIVFLRLVETELLLSLKRRFFYLPAARWPIKGAAISIFYTLKPRLLSRSQRCS